MCNQNVGINQQTMLPNQSVKPHHKQVHKKVWWISEFYFTYFHTEIKYYYKLNMELFGEEVEHPRRFYDVFATN